jgi:hypothetical protein
MELTLYLLKELGFSRSWVSTKQNVDVSADLVFTTWGRGREVGLKEEADKNVLPTVSIRRSGMRDGGG